MLFLCELVCELQPSAALRVSDAKSNHAVSLKKRKMVAQILVSFTFILNNVPIDHGLFLSATQKLDTKHIRCE